jgi:hypothetical protein
LLPCKSISSKSPKGSLKICFPISTALPFQFFNIALHAHTPHRINPDYGITRQGGSKLIISKCRHL